MVDLFKPLFTSQWNSTNGTIDVHVGYCFLVFNLIHVNHLPVHQNIYLRDHSEEVMLSLFDKFCYSGINFSYLGEQIF